MKSLLAALVVLFWVAGARGAEPPPSVDEAEIETRLRTLAEELRCVVCQNESLAESRASLAVDLRSEMRAMMRSGMSDEAVVDSLVDRYGDFILYRPPLKPATWLLWAGPLLILLVAGGVAVTAVRRRAGRSPEADVSAEDLAQAATLLREARTRPEDGRGTDTDESRQTTRSSS